MITEIQMGKGSVIIDEFGQLNDWIEIYNPTDKSINLQGYGISDQVNRLNGDCPVDIEPKSFLLVYASGRADGLHNFGLKSESVGLFSPIGRPIDLVPTAYLPLAHRGCLMVLGNIATQHQERQTNLPTIKFHCCISRLWQKILSPLKSDWVDYIMIPLRRFNWLVLSIERRCATAAMDLPQMTIGAKSSVVRYMDKKCAPPNAVCIILSCLHEGKSVRRSQQEPLSIAFHREC